MSEQKLLLIRCEGAALLDINEMTPIQGALKFLSKENNASLRARIEKVGFKEPISIWKHDGRNDILSGTQRWTILSQMRKDGWVIPKIPVNITHAENLEEAKRDILGFSSQFGQITTEGMLDFLSDSHFTAEDLAKYTRLANFDTLKFIEDHKLGLDDNDVLAMTGEVATPEPVNASNTSHVRMIQLFFDEAQQVEFLAKMNYLQTFFESTNLTEAVLEVVRESYQANKPS